MATSARPVRRPDVIDLVGEIGQQQLFDLRAVAIRFVERNVGQPLCGDDQGVFAEPGNEFGSQPAGQHGGKTSTQPASDEYQPAMQQGPRAGRADRSMAEPDRPGLAIVSPAGQKRGRPRPESASATGSASRPGRTAPSGPSAGTVFPRSLAASGSAGRRS